MDMLKEILTAINTTPLPTILVVAGLIFLLVGVITLEKPIVIKLNKKEKTVARWIGTLILVLGIALYVLPFIISSVSAAPTEITMTPTPEDALTSPEPTLTTTPSLDLTPALTPIASPTPTLSPTPVVPASPSPIPTSVLFGDGKCISADAWMPYQGVSLPINKNGCWDLEKWGMFAHTNFILSLKDITVDRFYGIYKTLPASSVVSFTIQINELTTLNDEDGNIAVAVIPNNAPDPNLGVELLFQVETSPPHLSPIRLKTHERNEPERYIKDIPAYEFEKPYMVRMELIGNSLVIYLNDQRIAGPLNITFQDSSLWIGYRLPVGGTLSAEISDFVIEKH